MPIVLLLGGALVALAAAIGAGLTTAKRRVGA